MSGLLDELEIAETDLIGYSYGGFAALNYAIRAPHRINNLVLLSPVGGLVPLRTQFYIRGALGALGQALHLGRLTMKSMFQWMFYKPNLEKPEMRQVVECIFNQMYLGGKHFRPEYTTLKNSVWPTIVYTDEELQALKSPTLLLIGQQEALYSPEAAAARARRLIPHIQTEIIPGAGHDLPVSKAAEVNSRILGFLEAGIKGAASGRCPKQGGTNAVTIGGGTHTKHPVDRPNPQLRERDVLRTLGTDRVPGTTSKVRRFLLHYAEMQVPMALGALVCYLVVTPIADSSSVYRPGTYLFAAGDVLVLTIPVVAWMLCRGHSMRHSLEMGIAMLAPVAAIVVVGELAGFAYLHPLVIAGYPALSLGMLVYMLHRREGSDSGSIGDGKVAFAAVSLSYHRLMGPLMAVCCGAAVLLAATPGIGLLAAAGLAIVFAGVVGVVSQKVMGASH